LGRIYDLHDFVFSVENLRKVSTQFLLINMAAGVFREQRFYIESEGYCGFAPSFSYVAGAPNEPVLKLLEESAIG
jgi:hypothetical protein